MVGGFIFKWGAGGAAHGDISFDWGGGGRGGGLKTTKSIYTLKAIIREKDFKLSEYPKKRKP